MLDFFFFLILIFHGVLILSLSNQVLVSHSPCTYLVHTLQADVGFFFLILIFHGVLILSLSLSNQVLGLYSPTRCWIFFFNLNFSWGFDTLTLQPGFRFLLSMHIFGLHSPSRYWILIRFLIFLLGFYIFHFSTLHAGFPLLLSNPCKYLFYILSADIKFFKLFKFHKFSFIDCPCSNAHFSRFS